MRDMSHAAVKAEALNREIERIETCLRENDLRREEYREKLEAARTELHTAEEKLAQVRDRRQILRTEQEQLERELGTGRAELARLEEESKNLQQELSGLFALAFGKKKEVRGRIEENERARAEQKDRLAALEAGLDLEGLERLAAEEQETGASLVSLKSAVEELDGQLEQLARDRAEPERELGALRQELAEAEQAEEARLAKAEADARRAADCAQRHREWPLLEDDRLRDRRDRAMVKLEALYPEHKVFALAALNDELRASLVKLGRACGYESTDDLLNAHGFTRISGTAVRELRPQVQYAPGSEPEVIRGKVEAILRRLEEYYPEKEIPGGLERDHKALSGDISGVAQWLGYGSRKEFLESYGFRYDDSCVGGRPALEIRPILEALFREYGESETKPRTLSALTREHPELRPQLKTLSNRARSLFGEPLAEHLKKLDILAK